MTVQKGRFYGSRQLSFLKRTLQRKFHHINIHACQNSVSCKYVDYFHNYDPGDCSTHVAAREGVGVKLRAGPELELAHSSTDTEVHRCGRRHEFKKDMHGHCTALISDQAINDPEGLCNYTRMNPGYFNKMA